LYISPFIDVIIPYIRAFVKALFYYVKGENIMSNILKKVAKQNGVSVKEVRKDLEEMIKVVMS
jgi:predicted DsbA family dithiol-disulfide isomerase